MKQLIVKSTAFENNKPIPKKYACDGENMNPPLTIDGIPPETKSLAIIVEDPDAPYGTFGHWVVWNLAPTKRIEENTSSGIAGLNDFGKHGYGGPCPPYGTHRYIFKIFALDKQFDLNKDLRRTGLETAIKANIIAEGKIVGLYSKK